MRYVVEPMAVEDIDEVIEIEKEAFTTAWSPSSYRRDLLENRSARYIVLRELPDDGGEGLDEAAKASSSAESEEHRTGLQRIVEGLKRLAGKPQDPSLHKRGRILGVAGMWLIVDEAHLTTIAVRSEYRGRGFGEVILVKALDITRQLGFRVMTLEVRVSNVAAQSLYKKYGFQTVGLRRRYYTDNNEDALIMTTDEIASPEFEARFAALKAANARRTGIGDP